MCIWRQTVSLPLSLPIKGGKGKYVSKASQQGCEAAKERLCESLAPWWSPRVGQVSVLMARGWWRCLMANKECFGGQMSQQDPRGWAQRQKL